MGASAWMYYTPYNQDLQQTLNQLRHTIFIQNEYHVRPAFDSDFEGILPVDASEEDREELWEQFQVWSEEKQPEQFHSIDELVEWNAEEGTHSILDISMISEEVQPDTAAPLKKEQLRQLFGTDTPNKQVVERIPQSDLLDYLQQIGRKRYEATYIILYEGQKPTEILFIGYSGD